MGKIGKLTALLSGSRTRRPLINFPPGRWKTRLSGWKLRPLWSHPPPRCPGRFVPQIIFQPHFSNHPNFQRNFPTPGSGISMAQGSRLVIDLFLRDVVQFIHIANRCIKTIVEESPVTSNENCMQSRFERGHASQSSNALALATNRQAHRQAEPFPSQSGLTPVGMQRLVSSYKNPLVFGSHSYPRVPRLEQNVLFRNMQFEKWPFHFSEPAAGGICGR